LSTKPYIGSPRAVVQRLIELIRDGRLLANAWDEVANGAATGMAITAGGKTAVNR
jgi:hypothetical protein